MKTLVSEKIIHYSHEDGIEKSVPRNHGLSSLLMPIGDPLDGFLYPTFTLMMDSYNPD